MARRKSERYRDVKAAVSQFQNLVPEEFPEGPYGSPIEYETLGKSTPWKKANTARRRSPTRCASFTPEFPVSMPAPIPRTTKAPTTNGRRPVVPRISLSSRSHGKAMRRAGEGVFRFHARAPCATRSTRNRNCNIPASTRQGC